MGLLESLSAWNAEATVWFDAHPRAYFLTLVCAPVLTFLGLAVATGGHVTAALVRGLAFGVVFASITVLTRRYTR